jgi:hypothetical protein
MRLIGLVVVLAVGLTLVPLAAKAQAGRFLASLLVLRADQILE